MPKVTVVVPNYNHEPFLRQRIESILAQSFTDFELILLDDASTDGSMSILKEYSQLPNARLIVNETNSGSAFKQWNKGFREAHGDYVWIAESDDYAEPGFLATLVDALEAHSGAGLACCRSYVADSEGAGSVIAEDRWLDPEVARKWGTRRASSGRTECASSLIVSNFILNASAVLFRREMVELAGYADESLRLAGDWKLYAAMLLESDIVFVPDVLSHFRCHQANVRSAVRRCGRHVIEPYLVARYIADRVPVGENRLEQCRRVWCEKWVRDSLRLRIAVSAHREVYRAARALDAHIGRRLVGTTMGIAARRLCKVGRSANIE